MNKYCKEQTRPQGQNEKRFYFEKITEKHNDGGEIQKGN